jgi:ribosome maturation factor RimP
MVSAPPKRDRFRAVIEPVVTSFDYDLEELTVSAAGKRSVVRVVVDGDGGIDLDAVALVSRAISEVLDATEGSEFAGPFVLEVTSPGVDRPLSEPRHWRRAVGRMVAVTVDDVPVIARVTAATDAGITVLVVGAKASLDLTWNQLGVGRVQVEFSRPKGARAPGETDADDVDADEFGDADDLNDSDDLDDPDDSDDLDDSDDDEFDEDELDPASDDPGTKE